MKALPNPSQTLLDLAIHVSVWYIQAKAVFVYSVKYYFHFKEILRLRKRGINRTWRTSLSNATLLMPNLTQADYEWLLRGSPL